MANSFYMQILSVNRLFYSGRCESLIFQEEDGEREIQAYHENMIIAVHEGEIRFRPEDSKEWVYGVVGVGFVQIANNRVTLLVETAESPEEIDIRRAEEAKERPWSSSGKSRAFRNITAAMHPYPVRCPGLRWQNDSTVKITLTYNNKVRKSFGRPGILRLPEGFFLQQTVFLCDEICGKFK